MGQTYRLQVAGLKFFMEPENKTSAVREVRFGNHHFQVGSADVAVAGKFQHGGGISSPELVYQQLQLLVSKEDIKVRLLESFDFPIFLLVLEARFVSACRKNLLHTKHTACSIQYGKKPWDGLVCNDCAKPTITHNTYWIIILNIIQSGVYHQW